MITKKDAIAVGTAICKGVIREQELNTSKTVVGTDYRDEKQSNRVWGARGAGLAAMDNLWYDVIPNKLKYPHGQANLAYWTREQFYKECGWPE
jgi:hypothetical protein